MAGVSTEHPQFKSYLGKWKRCRDVVAGQDAMRAATTAYLPKLKRQKEDDYNSMLSRANFYNATWRTISGFLGMMFRKNPAVVAPVGLEKFFDDISMSNKKLNNLAREVAGEILEVGRVGLMVDYPANNDFNITVADADTKGLRPTLQVYLAESIINWRHQRINNKTVLSLVVLKESVDKQVSEFEVKSAFQYRVLDLFGGFYRMRLFEVVDNVDVQIGNDFYPIMNGQPMSYIPFGIIGVDGIDSVLDEPPLIDLVDHNVAWYQVNADMRHGLHMTALPTAVVTGYSPEQGAGELYVGSMAAWVFSDPNASAKYLEFSGSGIEAIADHLKELKQDMAMLGARMIADETKQVETLGATAIKRTGENAVLSSIAIALSDSLSWALKVFAEWAGEPSDEIYYEINRDFLPNMLSAGDLTALMAAVQQGHISSESLFDLLQRGDIVDSELSYEEEQARIDGNPPLSAPVITDPNA